MITRSVLLYVPGYPFEIEALMPRRRLASLAGGLLDAGHQTEVWDYGRLDVLDTYFPSQCRPLAQNLATTMYNGDASALARSVGNLVALRRAGKAFRKQREALCIQVARDLVQLPGLDFVTLEINEREDLDAAATLLRVLRAEAPQIRTSAIGQLVSNQPMAVASVADELDCLCLGDEEGALVHWASVLWDRDAWAGIGNLVYQNGQGVQRTPSKTLVDLRAQAEPAYEPDVYAALEGPYKLRLFEIEDSRGCGCRCNTCAGASCGSSRLRLKPVNALREELVQLASLYGVQAFHFDGFGAPASHAVAVARAMEGRGQRFVYSRGAHAGYANPAAFETLHASGCRAVNFRVDTGSQRLLDDFYGTGLQVSKVERVLQAAKKAGLYTIARLTYPAPDDDYHTRAETLRLLNRTRPDAAPVALPECIEGGRWQEGARAFGFERQQTKNPERRLMGPAVFPLPPSHWRVPGGRVGGYSPSQAVSGLETMRQEIAGNGFTTIGDERAALMAHVLGQSENANAFIAKLSQAFMTGDWSGLADMVNHFNDEVCDPAIAGRFTALAGLRSAVGD
jgi:hypothetical protein